LLTTLYEFETSVPPCYPRVLDIFGLNNSIGCISLFSSDSIEIEVRK